MLKSEIIARHERQAASSEKLGHAKSASHYRKLAQQVREGAADADIVRYHGAAAIDC